MSRSKSGVCTRIQEIQLLAEYHHYRAYALNVVISSSCKNISMIRNLFFMFINSLGFWKPALRGYQSLNAKQVDYLVGNNEDDVTESNKNIEQSFSVNIMLCETRWFSRVDTLSVVIGKYAAILSSLDDVRNESAVKDALTKAITFINMMERSAFMSESLLPIKS